MATETKPLAIKDFSVAQRRNLQRLIAQINRDEWGIEQARAKHDDALAHANNFVGYCADEFGIVIGQDGWAFDQDNMRFVQVKVDESEAPDADVRFPKES